MWTATATPRRGPLRTARTRAMTTRTKNDVTDDSTINNNTSRGIFFFICSLTTQSFNYLFWLVIFSIIKKERGVLGEVKSRGCVRHALYARVGCEVPISLSLSLSDEHVAVLLLGGGERGPRAWCKSMRNWRKSGRAPTARFLRYPRGHNIV